MYISDRHIIVKLIIVVEMLSGNSKTTINHLIR